MNKLVSGRGAYIRLLLLFQNFVCAGLPPVFFIDIQVDIYRSLLLFFLYNDAGYPFFVKHTLWVLEKEGADCWGITLNSMPFGAFVELSRRERREIR